MAETSKPPGPDLAQGISVNDLPEAHMLASHVANEPVLIVRHNGDFFAIGAVCSHYGGPLAEGLLQDDTVRCPWHHACFSLRTGEALRPPALSPVACWTVERRADKLFVGHKQQTVELTTRHPVYCTLARSPLGSRHSRRALGRGRAPGPDSGA